MKLGSPRFLCKALLVLGLMALAFWDLPERPLLSEGPHPASFSSYNFSGVEKSLGPVALHRINELTKQSFEFFLIQNVPFNVRKNFSRLVAMTLNLAEWYQVDPLWVLAVMWVEGHYRSDAVSARGALGPMQIMPETGDFLAAGGGGQCPGGLQGLAENQVENNVEMGIVYLKCLLKIFHNDMRLATLAYNMGPGRVKQQIDAGGRIKDPYWKKVRKAYYQLTTNFEKL